jgi:hypothetical protein
MNLNPNSLLCMNLMREIHKFHDCLINVRLTLPSSCIYRALYTTNVDHEEFIYPSYVSTNVL